MSKTASIGLFRLRHLLWGRLMVTIDRLLMNSSRIAIRNAATPCRVRSLRPCKYSDFRANRPIETTTVNLR